jgi:hypothetical protein
LSTSLQSITLHDDSRFSSPPALAGLFDQLDRIHAEGFGQLADRCHVRLGSVLLYSVNGVLADAGEFGEVLLPQVRGAKLGRRDYRLGKGILRGVLALDFLGGRRWTMSRLLRVGDKVINLDNIEYISREESSVVRIHFVHRDIELWNEQGEAFRQWVLSNAEYCEGSGEGW